MSITVSERISPAIGIVDETDQRLQQRQGAKKAQRKGEPNIQDTLSPRTKKSFETMKYSPAASYNLPSIQVTDTKKYVVPCSYHGVGCEFRANANNMELLLSHTEEKKEHHLRLTYEAYKKLKSENEELRKKYEKLKNDWNTFQLRTDLSRLHPNVNFRRMSQPADIVKKTQRKLSPGKKSYSYPKEEHNSDKMMLGVSSKPEFKPGEKEVKKNILPENAPDSINTQFDIEITESDRQLGKGTSEDNITKPIVLGKTT